MPYMFISCTKGRYGIPLLENRITVNTTAHCTTKRGTAPTFKIFKCLL